MEDFFEKYELLNVEKECESTKIYRARNKVDGTIVYINLYEECCCEEFIKDLFDNLEMYKNIDNENIVKIYDVGKCCIEGVNYDYIEKEFVEGKSLDCILDELGRLDVDKALIIARHIIDGINYFHKNKSCDGNLRPRNIIVGLDGEVKLDLLVYPKHEECDLGYTSPEQAIVNYITIYDDIYSLGAILFRMITGRLPFGEFESKEDVFKVVSEGLDFIKEDGLDDQLMYLFVKSLQARPLDRYFDLNEFLEDIDECLKCRAEDRKIVVIDDEGVSTYHLDDEGSECEGVEPRIIIDEDVNVINENGSLTDISAVVLEEKSDLDSNDTSIEDGLLEDTSKVDEEVNDADNEYKVEAVNLASSMMDINNTLLNEDKSCNYNNLNMVNDIGDTDTGNINNEVNNKDNEIADKSNYTDKTSNEFINNKCKVDKDLEENEDADEDEDKDHNGDDYAVDSNTKKLKVMVSLLSVAVCVVGVASFGFIKDMMDGSSSYNADDSGGSAVLNTNDDENEEELEPEQPPAENYVEDLDTNTEDSNTEENNSDENSSPEENHETNTEENTNGGNHNQTNNNSGSNTNNNQNNSNQNNNNSNNNSQNNNSNNNSNNNNSQDKPSDNSQNNGNNQGNNENNNGDNGNNNNSDNNNSNNGENTPDGGANGGTENPDGGNSDNSNNEAPPQPDNGNSNGEPQKPQNEAPVNQPVQG